MQDLLYAIDENIVDYFELVPKYFPKPRTKNINNRYIKDPIRGQVQRFKENDEKIVIEILDHFEFVLENYRNDLYDILFELNRMPYQLQHYALDFVKKQNLFDILIENDQYYQTPTFDAPRRNHNLK